MRVRADDYVGSGDASDPAVSPIFADLHGLSPILIQAGANEVLLDDSCRLAERAAAADVAVTLDVTPGGPHLFQSFAGILDEGSSALDRVATFLATYMPPPAGPDPLEPVHALTSAATGNREA